MKRTGMLLLFFLLYGCSKSFKHYYDEAHTSFAEEKYTQAIDFIDAGLPLWEEGDGRDMRGRALELKGRAYHRLKNYKKATESYSKAIRWSTNTYTAAYNLGTIYNLSGEYKLAINAFSKALELKKDDPMALLGLGNAHFGLKNYSEAKKQFQRILLVSPGVKDALDNIDAINSQMKRRRTNPQKQ